MKKYELFVVFWLMTGFVFSAYVGSLPEVMKPYNIKIAGSELYVMEDYNVSVYSLKDLKLIRKFGKKGEGPGEIQILPSYSNKLDVYPDYILVETPLKLIYFKKEGTFLKEIKKKSYLYLITLPVGKNFVINKALLDRERKIAYSCICLFDPKMNEIKELYRQKHPQQGFTPPLELDMTLDLPLFEVADDKIFIEESPEGFIIDVFDSKGSKLYRIKKEFEKIKISDDRKDEMFKRFIENPAIKAQGGWEQVKNRVKLIYPDTFPAIKGIAVSGNKLYVQTHKRKDNKEEYVIMDLKGKVLKKVYIHRFENVTLNGEIFGTKLHTIYNDKLYYLMENEDEEEWGLHVEEIK